MSAGSVALVVPADLGVADLYELGIPAAVFGTPQPDLADPWYELRVCAVDNGTRAAPGFTLHSGHGLDDIATAGTVIVPWVPAEVIEQGAPVPPELLSALRDAHEAGARIVALCGGAFALAEAGLLDGRRAVTHWMCTALLAERYPEVRVDDSVLYVDDGDVLTSAGMTASLDLCLHLVRRDLGAHVANQLARRMVVPAHRPGSRSQLIDLSVPATDEQGLAPVLDWARARLDQPLTIEDLARRAAVSPRTFYRRLHAATGTTPLQWLLDERVARAQALLESTDLSVEKVAALSGIGTANNLRHHFLKQVGVSPSDYRQAFARHRR
ncbi:Transcriptional regulator GlxA family, contains an amidase domain and an AraC-type DNA-binding HTH domain [Lentzea xinjiangensis]|uniref:Transcriptional regulator GlxA family, contains an amidase domain and an AraC-type DNA-binding HTH domain n=1 Tax=Lentzea xinjiangensis TaxID=402600 RepID=A0A1H9BDN4_9PSEU|nr:helix-turn-helix domain-containing protein [Lentzea xinjiangensis]SEP86743.1 Transcriptional regulator GlxA family, contains an amidase domain and an AraC-type DNA-binding HTH domain [Lentzea xinjiangensis]